MPPQSLLTASLYASRDGVGYGNRAAGDLGVQELDHAAVHLNDAFALVLG